MPHHWIPNSSEPIKWYIMREIGIKDINELFKDIPSELRIKGKLNIGFGRPLTEYEVNRLFTKIVSKNKVYRDPPPFIGGGFCIHYVPAVIKYLIERGEFLTSYTPYQAEINQGVLQALFEFQSLIAELYDVDIVNASLYNGSTAAAEAIRMALRVKRGRSKVIILGDSHPEVIETIRTWISALDVKVITLDFNLSKGYVPPEVLNEVIDRDVAAVYFEYPNFFGVVSKDIKEYIDIAHDVGALAISYSNPLALALFKPPGSYGADIVVGDAQPLGMGLNFGGPTAGFIGIHDRKELLRQLPGRLVGATLTEDGKEVGYTLILQTREQHIRRERATSNITTNSALMAIASAIYLALLGRKGIKELAKAIAGRTYYLINELRKLESIKAPAVGYDYSVVFREFTIGLREGNVDELYNFLRSKGYAIGPKLSRFYGKDELRNCSLVCVTEVHSREDIDGLIQLIKEFTLRR